MDVVKDFKKYVKYLFDSQGFAPVSRVADPSAHALRTAGLIRGSVREPAIIIHGVMKRSGTVYSGELLGLHLDLCPYPNEVWEIPFLPLTGDILKMQQEFFFVYESNVGKIGEHDFLPLFGSALVAYLYAFVPEGQRMLLKMPGVQYLDYFYSVFPYENLLLLVRDGRDVVTSTVRTWPQIRFTHACRRWRRSADQILRFQERHSGRPGYWLARFEDAVLDPTTFVREVCRRFDLDENRYPHELSKALPVHGSSELKEQGKLVGFVPKPENFDPIGRWQEWPAGKRRTFKRIAGQALLDLGYCQDLEW